MDKALLLKAIVLVLSADLGGCAQSPADHTDDYNSFRASPVPFYWDDPSRPGISPVSYAILPAPWVSSGQSADFILR
jgi:hypothetical protein